MERIAFDVVGSIALLSEKVKNKKRVAKELLRKHKNIKTVLVRKGIHSGKLRLQKYGFVAGDKTKETIHKENNVRLFLDVEKTYFSARTGNERLRISKLVKKNEKVLVMFSGVAPYPILISKNSKAKEIYGVELNKDAHYFGEENINLNKVDNVKLFGGNVSNILPKLNIKFDRIVMPLPKSASRYIELAKRYLKKKGFLHLYVFSKEKPKKEIKGLKLLRVVKCGTYSPGKDKYCLDFQKI